MVFRGFIAFAVLFFPLITSAQFTDDFNRANETLDASANWDRPTAGGQDIDIVSNALETGAGTGRRLYRSPDQADADQYVQITVPTLTNHPAPTQTSVAIRTVDRQNYIRCGVSSGNNFDCGIRIANVFTSHLNTTPSGGDIIAIKIEAEGTDIRYYYDNGSGWILALTETGVTDFQTETRAGLVDASGTSGRPTWDDYENGALVPAPVVDWVQDIEDHFDVDFFASGTTYYFNGSKSAGTATGLSNANAFYEISQVDAKSFAAGDQLLFLQDQATIADVKLKNDSMVGTGAGDPFLVGAYHMSGGAETYGLSGGPYVNTPGGRPCIDGSLYSDFDYYGAMSNAELQAMVPAYTAGQTGSLEGIFNWYQASAYDLDLKIENLCFRATGGRGIRFTQTGSAQADWLFVDNLYIEGTGTQGIHFSGVTNFIMEDSFVTMTDTEHKYDIGNAGNTQAMVAFKGTSGDPDTRVKGVFRRNAMWDSVGSEGVQSNSGGKHILIEHNIIVDGGHVACIYLDRTYDMTVRYNMCLHTEGRTEFENQTSAFARGWTGIFVQNETSCGSFDWCSTYNTPADFALYATQRAVIEYNIVAGWRFSYGFQSSASATTGQTHTGEDHGAGIYWYNNMSLDPDDRHFSVNTSSPSDYNLRTDIPQRAWGNVFINSTVGGGNGVDSDRNETQLTVPFDRNYWSSNITVKTAYDGNMVTTGITMPLSTYYTLDTYMVMDADDHMDYTNFRAFLTTMGLDPDNLANKTLSKFKPTANVVSGLTLSNLTFPADNESGTKQDLDIEGNAVPSSPFFGPFAGVGQSVTFVPPFIQQMNRGVGPQKSQTLSGGID